MTLEDLILENFGPNGLSTINLFRTEDGFQCNVTHRASETYGISKSTSPIKAISKAIEICTLDRNGVERSKKPLAKPTVDDML